jgi:hypothetical protein
MKEVNMKNNLVSRILTAAIALAAAVTVHAQDKAVTATVPFNFYVGSTAMPQGDYRLVNVSNGAVLTISSTGNEVHKAITTMHVVGKSLSEPPRLVFVRYGDVYFLHQVWTGNDSIGQALGRSQREKALARDNAAPTLAVIRLALR